MSWELDLPSPWFPGWREEGGYDYRCCRPVWDCCDYQSDFYDDWRRIEKDLKSEIKKRRAGNGPKRGDTNEIYWTWRWQKTWWW